MFPAIIMAPLQNAGLMFISNGEIATHTGTVMFDYVNGKGRSP